jgi:hypothetical protein
LVDGQSQLQYVPAHGGYDDDLLPTEYDGHPHDPLTAYSDSEPLLRDADVAVIEARIRSAFPSLPDDAQFLSAVVEWEERPPEAHFILLVPHPKPYAKGARLQYVGSTPLSEYRAWEKEASHFVHGSSEDPAVIAYFQAARIATEALDTINSTID